MKTFMEILTLAEATLDKPDGEIRNTIDTQAQEQLNKLFQQLSNSFQPNVIKVLKKIETKLNVFALTLGNFMDEYPEEGTQDFAILNYTTEEPMVNAYVEMEWKMLSSGQQDQYRSEGSELRYDMHIRLIMVEPGDLDFIDESEEISEDTESFLDEEQIDELSKATLGSYVKKASATNTNKAFLAGQDMATRNPLDDDNLRSVKKQTDKVIKRVNGISKATDKLTKEETELDEGLQDVRKLKSKTVESEATKKEVRELLPDAKIFMKRHVPAVGYVMFVKDGAGKTIGQVTKERGEGVTLYIKEDLDEASNPGLSDQAEKVKKLKDNIRNAEANLARNHVDSEKKLIQTYISNQKSKLAAVTSGVKEDLDEEQIDELSKSTLGSYVKKASVQKANSVATNSFSQAFSDKDNPNAVKNMNKRHNGINKAVDKLTKEETELQEAVDAEFRKLVKSMDDKVLLARLSYFRNKDQEKYNVIVSEVESRGLKEGLEEAELSEGDGYADLEKTLKNVVSQIQKHNDNTDPDGEKRKKLYARKRKLEDKLNEESLEEAELNEVIYVSKSTFNRKIKDGEWEANTDINKYGTVEIRNTKTKKIETIKIEKDRYEDLGEDLNEENDYIAFYNGTQRNVKASSSYEAQKKGIELFKPPKSKSHMVHVKLAKKDGEDVVHTATESLEEAKIEAYGVKGMKSTKWRKVFNSVESMEAWAEKNDAEIQGHRGVEGHDSPYKDESYELDEEQIDELSKDKLKDYLHKNGNSKQKARKLFAKDPYREKRDDPKYVKASRDLKNRMKGGELAADKIMSRKNEEMELDEAVVTKQVGRTLTITADGSTLLVKMNSDGSLSLGDFSVPKAKTNEVMEKLMTFYVDMFQPKE